jgi:DNA-binding GntR family transcriptional regulator
MPNLNSHAPGHAKQKGIVVREPIVYNQDMTTRVHPTNRRPAVRKAVFERILSARLEPGHSVREVALSDDLGASRTPVREALIELQAEGLLEHDPGRGFIVPRLSERQLREIYPIIGELDGLAIELAPAHDTVLVERLGTLNDRFAGARGIGRTTADAEWHDCLASAGGNERLRDMLRTLRRIVQRYEVAYLAEEALVRRSVREHKAIAAALAAGERSKAARLLREHWSGSVARLLAVLAKSEARANAKARP